MIVVEKVHNNHTLNSRFGEQQVIINVHNVDQKCKSFEELEYLGACKKKLTYG